MVPSRKFGVIGLIGIVILVTAALAVPAARASSTSALSTSTSSPARFAGVNENWLGWDENTGTYPTDAAILDGLEQAKAAGFTVIRSQTLGVSTGQPDSLEPSYDVWNAAAFGSIDYTLAVASSLGLKVIIPLTDEWRYAQGGHWNFVHWAYENGVPGVTDTLSNASLTTANNATEKAAEQQFYSNTTIIGYFESYINHLLTHVNPYTGVEIADDPAVLAFESGNELFDSAASQGCSGCAGWTNTIAEYVKGLAPKALFIDGSVASGLGAANANGLTSKYVDWIDAHYYGSYESVSQLDSDAAVAQANGKYLYVGEYDWTGANVALSTWLSAIEANSDIIGDSPWDELPLIGTMPECHTDGFSFTSPASSGCPDTESLAVQSAALDLWALHSTIMAGTNLIDSSALQEANVSSLTANDAYGTVPTLASNPNGGTVVTATGGGPFWIYPPTVASGAPVTPGQSYTITATVAAGSTNQALNQVEAALGWQTSDGSWLGTSAGPAVSVISTDGTTTTVSATATAPATAAYAIPSLQTSQNAATGDSLTITGFAITPTG
jgi:hypothetical protein